ncbi:MAG: hypothetical protein Q4G24_05535 [Paracoccus sp. (in: a-proteobacteria)]|nr:hypothetical protein [Paracoccus sp. (in: a-proteobacteria)]MDO5620915.1 hypothetical protein [Paracoccus sp. (in: a-proteobacteria)]
MTLDGLGLEEPIDRFGQRIVITVAALIAIVVVSLMTPERGEYRAPQA